MEWWQIVGLILGSSVVTKLLDVWLARKARKDTVEDREMAETKSYAELNKKLDDFMEAQKKENAEIRHRLGGLEAAVQLGNEVSVAGEYTAIRKEACGYIKHGSVDPIDRAELMARYGRYLKLAHIDVDNSLVKFLDELARLRSEPLTLGGK